MRAFGFRRRVLLLAVALVTVVQLVTLFPVLDAIEEDANERARRTTRLAGVVFEEFMSHRAEQLATTAEVLVSDFGFKQAVASGDEPTIRSALANHAARAGASVALVLDPDGSTVTAWSEGNGRVGAHALRPPLSTGPNGSAVVDIAGVPYQAVDVAVRAPIVIARVMLGFPVDRSLAQHAGRLTGLDVSIVKGGGDGVNVVASTLPAADRLEALAGLDPDDPGLQLTAAGDVSGGFVTLLRPFFSGTTGDLRVALQLPVAEAMASYRSIRAILLGAAGLSLALAVTGAFYLANTVTRPVQNLAAAARRMREGDYNEPIEIRSADELGELAGGFNAMQEAIAERELRIFHQAHHDSLTGLPGRDLAISRLREALRSAETLSVVSLTLDRFNNVVSSLGHRAGDELITLVGGLLRSRVAEDQMLGHLGGHDFIIALPGFDAEQAGEWAAGAIDQLRSGLRVDSANVSLRGLAGVATHPDHGRDAAELVRRASIARAEARQRSERVVTYRVGQDERFLQQLRIVGDFPKALRENELELRFQPQIACATNDVTGVEALVRWRHPELGLLAPGEFVDAIEQAGGISHLTRWMLHEAVACSAQWRQRGCSPALAVNISVDDLLDEYLPYFLLDVVSSNGLPPDALTLEITENAIMRDVHKSLAVATCIHELGFRIAVDDFGVGQSALSQLKRLPVDELKIDKSFVMNVGDSRDEAIVRSTVELAHHLRLGVVAEGVESAEALQRLRELGCESAQGYYIAPPLSSAELLEWLAGRAGRGRDGVAAFDGSRRSAGAGR